MSLLFSPTGFLKVGGAVLLVLGLVGFTGAINFSWFDLDNGENIAHTVLGIVGLAVAFGLKNEQLHRWLVILIAVVALFFGVYGFLVAGQSRPNTFGLANLENPADNLLHLVVGAWAVAAVIMNRSEAKAPMAAGRA